MRKNHLAVARNQLGNSRGRNQLRRLHSDDIASSGMGSGLATRGEYHLSGEEGNAIA